MGRQELPSTPTGQRIQNTVEVVLLHWVVPLRHRISRLIVLEEEMGLKEIWEACRPDLKTRLSGC